MADDEAAERPRRRSSSPVREIPNASGACPDLFVEGQAVRELRPTPEGTCDPLRCGDARAVGRCHRLRVDGRKAMKQAPLLWMITAMRRIS